MLFQWSVGAAVLADVWVGVRYYSLRVLYYCVRELYCFNPQFFN